MIWSVGQQTEEACSEPDLRPTSCGGVNARRHETSEGGESDRPETLCFRDRHEWGWQCSWCGAIESGYEMEHHARTVGDEHTRTHQFADLDGSSSDTRRVPMAETGRDGAGGVLVRHRRGVDPGRVDRS